jgi:hypothetical protein
MRRWRATIMSKLRSLLLILAGGLALAGCSTFSNKFVDADGTSYESHLMVAPFSTLEGGDAQMRYKWNQTDGNIGVGASVSSIDQTGQIDVMKALIEAAIAAGTKAAVPIP